MIHFPAVLLPSHPRSRPSCCPPHLKGYGRARVFPPFRQSHSQLAVCPMLDVYTEITKLVLAAPAAGAGAGAGAAGGGYAGGAGTALLSALVARPPALSLAPT